MSRYDAVFDVQAVSDVLHGGWTIRLSSSLMRTRATAKPGSERGERGERDSAGSEAEGSSASPEGASPGGGGGAAGGGALAVAAAAPPPAVSAAGLGEAAASSTTPGVTPSTIQDWDPFAGREAAVVGVLGLYNTGKTFLLNQLTGTPSVAAASIAMARPSRPTPCSRARRSPVCVHAQHPFTHVHVRVRVHVRVHATSQGWSALRRMVTWLSPLTGLALPSSKCVATRGLSLRSATLAGSTPITLVDSEGSLAPVAMRHAHSLLERQAPPPTTDQHLLLVTTYYWSPPTTGHHLLLVTTSTLHGSLAADH